MNCLKVQNVTFAYQPNRNILSDIQFEMHSGESVGIVGANGVGKSTLLKLIIGLLDGFEGTIKVNQWEMNPKNLDKIRELIGYVFQDSDSQLFLSTVYEDVAFGPRNYGFSKEEVEQKVANALEKVQIQHLKERKVYQLSGGEKKLASIATILSMEPELILFDEPSVALDPKNRRNLISVINGMEQMKLIASHDLDFIMDTCERTILLADGRIVKEGKTMDILSDQKLLEENGLELPLRLQG